MSRRGCSLPANASGFDPHRASISSRFGQVAAGTLPGVRVLTPLGSARSTGLVVLAFDALPLPEEVAAAAEGGGSRRARLQLAAAPAPMAPNLLRHLVYTLCAPSGRPPVLRTHACLPVCAESARRR
jgi:hypothetical protein